ncbi:hypothetical protein HW49_07105 [Porphyromonadaceae bacterium COT-184 OH4590]|nr:hypothetical protein HW49_07105 [Porphyromonadaceae bacterium COT-184 OH4590]
MKKGAIVLEGHIQGLSNTRSLGELGIPVYVIDKNYCLAQFSKYCKKYFRSPSFQSEEFITFLISIAKKYQLKGWMLIASNDHIVENLSINYDKLAPYFKMLVPHKDNIYNIINKKKLMELAEKSGTNTPATCYLNNIENARKFRFPLLIKGNLGLSFYKIIHNKAIQVNNIEELEIVVNKVSDVTNDFMIQELIPYDRNNKVVSFTCFAEKGEIKIYWMGQKIREHPIKYGTATSSQSIIIPEVLESAKPLIASLNYTGVCEIEFIYDCRDNVYKLIEINPRTWLWVGLAKACGIDYAKIMYNYLMHIPQKYTQEYKLEVKWINWFTDIIYGFIAIIKKHISIKEYFSSLKGKKINAIWTWNDILPGVIFPFMLLYIIIKRR